MATLPSNTTEIIARLKQILDLDKVIHVFYVDNTINVSRYDLERIIGDVRDRISVLKENADFRKFFKPSIDYSVGDDGIIFNEIEQDLRDHDGSHEALSSFLFPGESFVKDDVSDELGALFGDIPFDALHPKEALDKFGQYFAGHTEGTVLFLFDYEFGQEMRLGAIQDGGDLIMKVCSSFPDKQAHMVFSLITHLVTQEGEIERRSDFITGDLAELKPAPFLLSKSRKANQLLLADGIKKALLNKLVEQIKDETLLVLEEAFLKTKGLINTLDTYEFEHIVVKSSLAEGVWMGKTLKRLSTVLFDNAINSSMVTRHYPANVNSRFEEVIQYSLINLLSNTESKPYNNRKFLRYQELYTNGDDLNKLHEPLANGDIFEVTLNAAAPGTTADYILVAQDCDVILRSNGSRNRSQRFFSLLPIDLRTKEWLGQKIVEFAEESKERNHYMSSKFLLPYYTSDNLENVGLVNFNNELVVYVDVLDLVSINSNGEANYDKDYAYPISEFSHSLKNRYASLIRVCSKFSKDITGIESGIGRLDNAVKDKIRGKFIKTLSPITEDKGTKISYLSEGKFSFGIRRKSRLKREHSTTLLMKYTQYVSRAALDHDFASE